MQEGAKLSTECTVDKTFNIPSWFYYKAKTSKEELTSIPTGQIEIDAFIQQSPEYWINDEALLLNKKKIIIADWTCKSWLYHRQSKIIAFFLQLAEKSFEFFYLKDSLVKISKEELYCLVYLAHLH